MTEAELGVVLPAFKSAFLATALESLARQSEKRFRVYVGDDASPEGLERICAPFASAIDLQYVRFAENLGRRSLAAQWSRCVRLSREPWVWLFSDDDFAHPDCVKSFRASIERSGPVSDLYRFPLGVIDQEGRVVSPLRSCAETQSAGEFALAKLKGEIDSFAVEYVFSRAAFEREGGFIEFPAGWCSDDASWFVFAGQRGIKAIEGGGVYWRKSAVNVSASNSPFRRDKIHASVRYLEWLKTKILDGDRLLGRVGRAEVLRAFRPWFYGQLYWTNPFLGPFAGYALARRVATVTGANVALDVCRFVRNDGRALIRSIRTVGRRII